MLRIGIDAGGTFTDLCLIANPDEPSPVPLPATGLMHKTVSTPNNPSHAVIQGEEMAEGFRLPVRGFLGHVDLIVHGTTVATNAVLTGSGVRSGLITTRGFRDVLEMRRGWREEVRDEMVSLETAQRDYGVALDPDTLEIDHEETARLREGARSPSPSDKERKP